MNRTTTVTVALAGMLVLSVLAPIGAAAGTDDASDLSAGVSADEGALANAANESAVDNSSVDNTTDDDPFAADENESESAFGQLLSQFVHENEGDVAGPFGLFVSDFVHEHNPGNASEHAGTPAAAGGNQSNQGPPDHAGNDDGDPGPPDHAGPPDGTDEEAETDGDDADEQDSDD